MKVLVIPDVHLKPFIFTQAEALMQRKEAEKAVCLMDIADDWNQQYNIDLYIQTYDAAIRFAKKYPETLWCYGNHDLSYIWNQNETGFSPMAAWTVCQKLHELETSLPSRKQLRILHRIDNVIFSHAGLSDKFVNLCTAENKYHDVDAVISAVNRLGAGFMWTELSPIWYRPQYSEGKMYREDEFLQVVGHTPVDSIRKDRNVISCDTFSTRSDHTLIGTQEFLLIDTETWEYRGIKP